MGRRKQQPAVVEGTVVPPTPLTETPAANETAPANQAAGELPAAETDVQVPAKSEQPAIKPEVIVVEEPAPVLTNRISVKFFQDEIEKVTNKKDGTQSRRIIPAVSIERYMETTGAEDNQTLTNWLVLQLGRYQNSASLRGGKAFDMTRPVQMLIELKTQDGVVAQTDGLKISMNGKRLQVIMDRYPNELASLFLGEKAVNHRNTGEVLEYLTKTRRQIIVPEVKQIAVQQDANVKAVEEIVNA